MMGVKALESSPVPGNSTFITSAPWSASIIVQYGPASTLLKSNTLIPANDFIIFVFKK